MKVKRPRGIFPSLPKGVDSVMKTWVQQEHAAGRPLGYLADVPGAQPYENRILIEKFRSWRTFQASKQIGKETITLSGELDELISFPEQGLVAPWDYKSKGSEPSEGYPEMYYQHQVDIYHALLEGQGLQCTGLGYFTFVWPLMMGPDHMVLGSKTMNIKTDPARAWKLAEDAANCLADGLPSPGPQCEYCTHSYHVRNALDGLLAAK